MTHTSSNEAAIPVTMKHILTFTALLVTLFIVHGTVQDAYAQPMGYNFGIGGQLGDPSGLSLEYYPGGGGVFGSDSYEFLLWWDTDGNFDHFAANIHALFDRPLSGAPLDFYYGPGFFLGFYERPGDDGIYAGISGQFGLAFDIDRFEIFGHLTPRLAIAPDTDGDLGGGIGARFYF